MERRSLPGVAREISSVTIGVDPPLVVPPAADDRTIALLRRSRELGVTTFDVAGARFPQRAERLIARAFPEPDPTVSAIVGRSVESLSRERAQDDSPPASSDREGALAASLEQSRRRLHPVPISVLEWEPENEPPTADAGAGDAAVTKGEVPNGLLSAVRLSSQITELPKVANAPALYSGALSLLEPDLVTVFEGSDKSRAACLLARDPFGSGRLDGSRFAASAGLSGPETGPVDLRRLHEEFDPVLRLGFLTERRKRTLAQAAVQFVLHWPWVVSVVVPLPTPERIEEILGFGGRPPISPEELSKLGFVK